MEITWNTFEIWCFRLPLNKNASKTFAAYNNITCHFFQFILHLTQSKYKQTFVQLNYLPLDHVIISGRRLSENITPKTVENASTLWDQLEAIWPLISSRRIEICKRDMSKSIYFNGKVLRNHINNYIITKILQYLCNKTRKRGWHVIKNIHIRYMIRHNRPRPFDFFRLVHIVILKY